MAANGFATRWIPCGGVCCGQWPAGEQEAGLSLREGRTTRRSPNWTDTRRNAPAKFSLRAASEVDAKDAVATLGHLSEAQRGGLVRPVADKASAVDLRKLALDHWKRAGRKRLEIEHVEVHLAPARSVRA